ncbi:MAG TPA: LysE family transporter, partial [Verrucomicrobiae bacterium]|nr:LysE family transporter [Verrucomicrobiae bacterium]
MPVPSLFALVGKGVLLGLGAAAPIGPVNVEIARRSLRGGFRAGFLLGCGAVTVDVTYAILTSLGLRPLLAHPGVMAALGIAGAAVLAYLGAMCFVGAARQWRVAAGTSDSEKPSHRHYVTGLAMTSLNPMTLAFWCIVVPGMVGQWSANPVRDLPWVCAGVFFGAISWVVFFAGTMTWVGRRGKRATWLIADLAGGTMLLGFATYALWRV